MIKFEDTMDILIAYIEDKNDCVELLNNEMSKHEDGPLHIFDRNVWSKLPHACKDVLCNSLNMHWKMPSH